MSTQDSKKSSRGLWGGLFRSGRDRSPGPRPPSSQAIAAAQSPKPKDTRAFLRNATDPHARLSNPLGANARVTRAGTDGGTNDAQQLAAASPPEESSKPPEGLGLEEPASATAANAQATRSSTDEGTNDAQEQTTASPHEKSSIPLDERGPKEPTLTTSQRLWNAAYDSVENDEAELVASYANALETVLRFEASTDPAS